MKYYNLYNQEENYIFTNGAPANLETLVSTYPLIGQIPFALETDKTGHIIFNITILELLKTQYNIDEGLTDQEAIKEIQRLANLPDDEVDSQIRIADALEDLVVLNMPDEEVE